MGTFGPGVSPAHDVVTTGAVVVSSATGDVTVWGAPASVVTLGVNDEFTGDKLADLVIPAGNAGLDWIVEYPGHEAIATIGLDGSGLPAIGAKPRKWVSIEAQIASVTSGAALAGAQEAARNAGTAASQASTAAQNAATAAGNALPKSGAGVANGTATLDSTGRLPITQAPLDILNDIEDLKSNGGGSGSGGLQVLRWRFRRSDATLAAGSAGNDSEMPAAFTASKGPRIRTDAAGSTGLSVDIEVDTGSGFASIYGTSKPTLVTGATDLRSANSPAPTMQGIPAGALVRAVVKTVPPGPSGGGTAATFQGSPTSKALPDAVDTVPSSPSSHGMALPAGGQAGDTVVRSIATTSGAATASMGAPWVFKQSVAILDGAGVAVVRVSHFAAPWSAALDMTVTTSQGTPSASWARVIRSTSPDLIDVLNVTAFQAGATWALPGMTAFNDYDLLAQNIVAFQPSVMTGAWLISATGSYVKETDARTTRTSASNISLAGYTKVGAVAAGSTTPAVTATISGGAGSANNVSWIGTTIGVRRATTSSGPSELFVELPLFGG